MSPAASPLPNVRGSMEEIHFAQRLADNDKKIRDRALKKLRSYLTAKSSNGPGFSDDDALKIWKGLFYCMYMADKPLVQEAVAEDISHLIHDLANVEDRYTFSHAAFKTFSREWDGIDVFRIDKFMMFVRRVLRQVFMHLRLQKWNLKEVARHVSILENCIIRPDDDTNTTSLGLKVHLCNIILEELAKIGGEKLSTDVLLAVIQPYIKVLALSTLKVYKETVCAEIFQHLMKQTDVGIKYEYHARNEIYGGPGVDVFKKDVDEGLLQNDGDEDDEDITDEISNVLDPRAGSVNVSIPQLSPDFGRISEALKTIGSLKKVSKVNRALIYNVARECQDMAGGVYPMQLPDVELVDETEVPKEEAKAAVDRLKNFHESLKTASVADLEKIKEYKDDDLKHLKITEGKVSKRSKKMQKKARRKLNKMMKNPNKIKTMKEKLAQSKQTEAAKLNRKKAVEGKMSEIAQVAKMPVSKVAMDPDRKAQTTTKKKKKKRTGNKKKQAEGVEVSSVPKGEKGAQKRKNQDDPKESPKRMKADDSEMPAQTADATEIPVKLADTSIMQMTPSEKKLKKNKGKGKKEMSAVHLMPNKEEKKLDSTSVVVNGGHEKEFSSAISKKNEPGAKISEKTVSDGATNNVFEVPDFSSGPSNSEVQVKGSGISRNQKKRLKQKEKKMNALASPPSIKTQEKISLKEETVTPAKKTTEKIASEEGIVVTPAKKTPKKIVSEEGIVVTPAKKTPKKLSTDEGIIVTPAKKTPKKLSTDVGIIVTPAKKTPKKLSTDEGMEVTPAKKTPKKLSSEDGTEVTPVKNNKKKTPKKLSSDDGTEVTPVKNKTPKKMLKGIPVSDEDIEALLKHKRLTKDALNTTPKIKSKTLKAKGIVSPMTPKSKGIKINLKQNKEHDFKDYAHSVKNSPQIPFSADKVPKTSVLKPSPSPILVRKAGLKILKNKLQKVSPASKNTTPGKKKKSPKGGKNRFTAADFF